MTEKWVYLFNELDQAESNMNNDWDEVRGLLGGKGANLAEMSSIGLPVPPGFDVAVDQRVLVGIRPTDVEVLGADADAPRTMAEIEVSISERGGLSCRSFLRS